MTQQEPSAIDCQSSPFRKPGSLYSTSRVKSMHIDTIRIELQAILRHGWQAIALAGSLLANGISFAQSLPNECGVLSVAGRFGPFDYRPEHYIPETTYRSHSALLKIVENAHFTPEVEANFRGKTSTTSGPDMAYTLHAFPNHHRALLSMIALGEKDRTDKPFGSPYVIECWLKRAVAFRPDDHIVRMIYASFLVKSARHEEADGHLRLAAEDTESNAFTFRNIGMIYLDMKRYDDALAFAHRSIALGLAGGPLQEGLKAAGRWTEPLDDKATKPKPP